VTAVGALAILGAGFVAGAVNTIVGSGSLLTFPTLLALGYPPVLANVSNTVGLSPGSISGVIGYRRELEGQFRRALVLGICSAAGAVTGGILLLTLPGSIFRAVVPALILVACLLIAVQPQLTRRLVSIRRPHRIGLGLVGVFLSGIYGGYFGAAQGVILVALLGIVLNDGLQRINALKNVLAAVVNVVAALLFIAVTQVAWTAAALIAAGSIVGAQVGAALGRRIPGAVLRWTIVVVGVAVAVVLLVTK